MLKVAISDFQFDLKMLYLGSRYSDHLNKKQCWPVVD
jgi:hypothetical protein